MPPRSLVLSAASLCAGGLAVLVYFHDSDLVLLREHLNHPFALGALACLLMALAAAGLRWMWLRVVIVLLSGLGMSVALFGGWMALAFSSTAEVGFVDGPDPYRIRLQRSLAGLGPDTVMWLSVRRDAGLLSREWDLGCFNDDVPDDALDSVTWTGPGSVEIRVVDGRTFPIALDPASGRPLTTAALNC
ncbi:hypothetical protein [Planomonospora venezuelensis]|uniref:Uncharacterized protein n=1 Tax=Planomonospora venezuelensis TaxID=1999 RepID=A0A841D4V4_PLAVE|nr:hypothetical protein [Planomonospora venezuelensis]MBB5963993.1 hypothetical protein [Planomonospora venezuelensis]GIN05072.1 hypothetical protein Pve01_67300 [Planomonospora venezuelensis]